MTAATVSTASFASAASPAPAALPQFDAGQFRHFDDAATGQGLLNYFLRGIACGAVTEDEALATGLSLDEIRSKSFVKIMAARRGGA